MFVAPSILVRYLVPAQYGAIRLSFFSQLKPMVNNNIVLVTHFVNGVLTGYISCTGTNIY